MITILFVSRDPGGTNCLIPIILAMRSEYICKVYAKNMASRLYEGAGIEFTEIPDVLENESVYMDGMLETNRPDILVTGTSADDFFERHIWMRAKERNIVSICILDSWCNYTVRFSPFRVSDKRETFSKDICFYPDHIIVMDEQAKCEMIDEGFCGGAVIPLGQPYLEYIKKKYESVSQAEVREYVNRIGGTGKKIILYASDNLSSAFPTEVGKEPYWGYDEVSTFVDIINAFVKLKIPYEEYIIVVRPHPKESVADWRSRVSKIQTEKKGIKLIVDDNVDNVYSLVSADVVIGMFSMLLTEAVIAQKKVISVQINALHAAPLFIEQRGFLSPCFTFEELCRRLQENYYISDDTRVHECIEEFNGSIQRIVKYIGDIIRLQGEKTNEICSNN